jgi:energy-coupling factor transport system ATP-binding protein
VTGAATPILEAAGLRFAYRAPWSEEAPAGAGDADTAPVTSGEDGPRPPALDGVTLSLEPGRLTVLMGPTGAGKSSLVRALHRAIPAFFPGDLRGEVRLRGRSLDGLGVADLAGEIGVVFQDFEYQLFSSTCALEVAFGPQHLGVPVPEIRRRVRECLGVCGLAGFDEREPSALSGGEKQRLAIAAVLALRPEVLLLDEPTTDLDPRGKRELHRLLRRLRDEGRTVLLVDTETEEAASADRLVLMRAGRIVAAGAPADLLRDPARLEACGVRPPEMVQVLAGLGLEPAVCDPDECRDRILAAGFRPRPADRPPTAPAAGSGAAGGAAGSGGTGDGGAATGEPIIRAEAVRFGYPDGTEALAGVTLRIAAGEFVAILGSNGSGKTTLAQVMAGILPPAGGRVLLHGLEPGPRRAAEIARRVGYVFQNPDHQIAAPTVADEIGSALRNFGVPAPEVARRAAAVLPLLGLAGREDRDPFILTRGERQRVALGAVLAYGPEVIIMDEPTTGLDEREQLRVMRLLADLNARGHTIVVITHALPVAAAFARRVVVLRGGRVAADGPTADLLLDAALLEEAGLAPTPAARLAVLLGLRAVTPAAIAARCARSPS